MKFSLGFPPSTFFFYPQHAVWLFSMSITHFHSQSNGAIDSLTQQREMAFTVKQVIAVFNGYTRVRPHMVRLRGYIYFTISCSIFRGFSG